MKRLIRIFRAHPLLASAFTLGLALTLFFTVRTVMFAIYWADPAHRDQALAGWMTPRYVAHSWDVPREVMAAVTGPLPEGGRPTLQAIAADQNIPLSDLTARIKAAIADHRAQNGAENGAAAGQ